MLEQTAHLSIASFVQADTKPAVTALVGLELDTVESGGSILELDPPAQAVEHRRGLHAAQPHPVLPFYLAVGMHEPVRQLAVVGEQQQARRVDIESPGHDPATA